MAGMSQKVFGDSDALFTRNGIAPVQDDRGDRELILMYPLPDSAQRIASLCSEVLASSYGVADDEPLLFTDFRMIHSGGACGSSRLTSSLRNKKAPGVGRGLVLKQQRAAYRLTWRLVPPPGAPVPGSPSETILTQSESLSLKYEVALALRSASSLSCGAPEAAVVNPGSSKITHEPRSSSVRVRGTDGLSVVTLISVPARTLVPPVTVKSLPLRLRTTGG